ncbi:hypothetical protein [Aestuariivirga sp.]|uniref:hypothetical protein n=1 Tax=Aestuariivirga sp. TaxID=2650926 RepID=UPI00391D43F7
MSTSANSTPRRAWAEPRTGRREKPFSLARAARYAVFCGAGAGIASQVFLAFAARATGQSVWRPINATSHWVWGERAGQERGADLAHTGVGLATNQAAALFWGTLFGLYLARRQSRNEAETLRDAAVMGLIASTLDYGILPRRLTPGWELALGNGGAALGMAATALGLGLGGIAAQKSEE